MEILAAVSLTVEAPVCGGTGVLTGARGLGRTAVSERSWVLHEEVYPSVKPAPAALSTKNPASRQKST